ncbi:MAG: SDR family oxidoreductase [Parasphingorhabdus sp.]|uniref:SDR family oxidoreductase n=1 Tax=Parasphingorhabdus sp. TaxID=2709688 RepID=UPI00300120C6
MSDGQMKLALVTGGVRRIGAHIAGRLADAGYALALHGHSDADPEDELAEKIKSNGTTWSGFVADFGCDGAAAELLAAVRQKFGRMPDLLVNNASVFEYDDAHSLGAETLEKHMKINMMVPTLLTAILAREVPEGARAAVINIVDQRVRNPNGDQLSYTLSKQALAESVRALAVACASNLRINGVAPGLTLATHDYSNDQMDRLATNMPLNQLSSPDEIADAVLYLAQAKSVTGQILFVDGGAHMKSFDRDFMFMERH